MADTRTLIRKVPKIGVGEIVESPEDGILHTYHAVNCFMSQMQQEYSNMPVSVVSEVTGVSGFSNTIKISGVRVP